MLSHEEASVAVAFGPGRCRAVMRRLGHAPEHQHQQDERGDPQPGSELLGYEVDLDHGCLLALPEGSYRPGTPTREAILEADSGLASGR